MCWKGFANTGKRCIVYGNGCIVQDKCGIQGAMSELMTEYRIPFVMKEHLNNIYEHFYSADMISYLPFVTRRIHDRKYFSQIANQPNRYLTKERV